MAASHDADVDPQWEYVLVIIGAGMEALSLVSRLPKNVLQKTAVIDSSGEWMAAWWRRAERLQTCHLRSPIVLHPHASPLALEQYMQKHGREQDTVTVPGHAALPSPALMQDFCRARIIRQLPKSLQSVQQDTVVRLEPLAGTAGCRVHLASGAALQAKAVVHTASCRKPIVPAWARGLALNTPAAAGITTWDKVDLRQADVSGKRVVVVGGGMASAALALGAVEGGAAAVTLLSRRQLQQEAYETPVGWWGNKQLNQYRQLESLGLRLVACRRARRQATLDQPTWHSLAEAVAAGKLRVIESCEVEAAAEADAAGNAGRWQLELQHLEQESAGGKARGASPFQQAVAAVASALQEQNISQSTDEARPAGKLADVTVAGPGPTATATSNCPPSQLLADLVWLACGSAYNLASDLLLCQLQQQQPTTVVSGYPWVDEEHLCWPGAPVFLAGRAAMLAVGPSAGELAGMRLAADRLDKSLKRLNYADAGVWEAARQKQLSLPAQEAGAGPWGVPPLEELGVMLEEPKPKVSVARPAHLVDVSDLPPDLPRKEVQKYTFTDCDFEICVIHQLDEPVPKEQVRVVFGPQCLDAWAVGQQAAYHLHLPRLWGRVVVKKCGVKVNQRSCKVYLLLHKECDAEWRYLKA